MRMRVLGSVRMSVGVFVLHVLVLVGGVRVGVCLLAVAVLMGVRTIVGVLGGHSFLLLTIACVLFVCCSVFGRKQFRLPAATSLRRRGVKPSTASRGRCPRRA